MALGDAATVHKAPKPSCPSVHDFKHEGQMRYDLRWSKGGLSMIGWYVLAGFAVAIIAVIVIGLATEKRKG
jgi:hypothetical protein